MPFYNGVIPEWGGGHWDGLGIPEWGQALCNTSILGWLLPSWDGYHPWMPAVFCNGSILGCRRSFQDGCHFKRPPAVLEHHRPAKSP